MVRVEYLAWEVRADGGLSYHPTRTSQNAVRAKFAEFTFRALSGAQSCLGPPYSGYRKVNDSPHYCPVDVREPKGEPMGINRWSDIEERKRNETDAKAGEEVPKGNKGDASSRLQASEEPAEDKEKRQVLEKLEKRERES